MHCPNCGNAASADQGFCRACGLSLPEFSQLLEEKLPTQPEKLKMQKRKAELWGLRLWTGAGIIFYIALYWAIISQIIIGKGHVLGGILFLLVITAISLGGLLILYSAALARRSAYRLSDQTERKGDTSPEQLASQPSELTTSVTENTTELLEKDVANEQQQGQFRG
jgi:type VI protein secretion system component VasK